MRRITMPLVLAVLAGPALGHAYAQDGEDDLTGEDVGAPAEDDGMGDPMDDDMGDSMDDGMDDPMDDDLGADPADAAASAETPSDGVTYGEPAEQFTLPQGRLYLNVFVEMNLSSDLVFKPFSIAPDLWYGVNDQISVGLVHSSRAATGLWGGVGSGLCLAGEDNGCAEVYDSVGIDGRYHFYRQGNVTASADGGLFISSFDPFTMALKLGAVGRWQSGKFSAEAGPNLFVGLTQRSPEEGTVVVGTGNKETLYLPINAMFAVMPKLGLGAQLGAIVPFQETGDTWLLGLALGAQYQISAKLFADLAFAFPALAGGPEGTGADFRTLTLGVGYAL